MAGCNDDNIGLKNFKIEDILKIFLLLLLPTPKLPKIPGTLILAGANFRPGLSPRKIASRIITRQNEAGAPQGPNTDGSDNIMEKMEMIRVEEMVYAMQNEARISVAIKPGQQVAGTFVGVGSGVINGQTVTNGTGDAIIS